MEDDLRWKTIFDGRRSLMEEDLRWKTTFDERRPLMEDELRWKTTFGGRRPSCSSSIFLAGAIDHSVLFHSYLGNTTLVIFLTRTNTDICRSCEAKCPTEFTGQNCMVSCLVVASMSNILTCQMEENVHNFVST